MTIAPQSFYHPEQYYLPLVLELGKQRFYTNLN